MTTSSGELVCSMASDPATIIMSPARDRAARLLPANTPWRRVATNERRLCLIMSLAFEKVSAAYPMVYSAWQARKLLSQTGQQADCQFAPRSRAHRSSRPAPMRP